MNPQQQFETPRRARQEDLHPPSNAASMSSPRNPLSPREYAGTAPRISLEQAPPESSQYHAPAQLPASLQPGRPGAISVNTAPAVPIVSQSNAQDQYTSPSRSSTVGVAHNYTRSSPATGFEGPQGYSPFSPTTPNADQAYFAGGSNSKYMPAQRAISNTPLGLADIRPRADSGISEGGAGANPYSYDGANATPTNSNYLAPWAIYAFDWCKWPAQNHDAGKLAVGSYLEDGHNFVSLNSHSRLLGINPNYTNTIRSKYSTRILRLPHQSRTRQDLLSMGLNLQRSPRQHTLTQLHAYFGNRRPRRSSPQIYLPHLETTLGSGVYQRKRQSLLQAILSHGPLTMAEIYRRASLHLWPCFQTRKHQSIRHH